MTGAGQNATIGRLPSGFYRNPTLPHLQPVQPQLRRAPVALQPFARRLPRGRRGHLPHALLRQPLVGRDLDVGPDPEPAGIAPRRHRRERVVRPRAFVRIDHARQFADEERAVVRELRAEAVRVEPVDLKMLRRDAVGAGDHRGLVVAQDDLAVIAPRGRRGGCGGEALELALHLRQNGTGERLVGGQEPDAGAHVVFGLGQKIGGDHLRVAGLVGEDVDLGWAGELVDADGAEDLPLGLVHEGVAGAHDLVDAGHGFGPVGHGGDGLRAADAEDPVRAGQVAARDHRRMGVGRQAGHDLPHARDLGRNDGHHRGGEQREAPAGDVSPDAPDRDHAVAHVDAGQRLHLQRADGGELRLGERADVGDGEPGVGAGLGIEVGDGPGTLLRRDLEAGEVGLIELRRIPAHGVVAMGADLGEDGRDEALDRGRVGGAVACGGLDILLIKHICFLHIFVHKQNVKFIKI